MKSRRPFKPSRWHSNAAGLAVLGLLLQLMFGQAAMLRMADAGGGMQCAPHHASGQAEPDGAPQPLAHHEDCPLCAGFAPMLGPVASVGAPPDLATEVPPAPVMFRTALRRPAPAYSSRAPPRA